MLEIEFKGLDKLVKDLQKAREQAFPYAQREAVNSAAFAARRIWGDEIKRTFVTRNQYTAGRALQVDKARDLRRPEATLGSVAKYMGEQETGGTLRGHRSHLPIPGPVAAGQAAGSKRTRTIRSANLLSSIRAAKASRGQTRKQRNAAALAIARRSGKKFAVLERPSGGPGLFAVSGGKRKTKARLVWDLSRKSAKLPPHATLGPTLKRIEPKLPELYGEALVKQLQRWHVLGY